MNYFNYLIVKAKKGWKATEMEQWSLEKKREILNTYGEEGLTPNSYAYLKKRVESENQPVNKGEKRHLTNDQVLLIQKSLGYKGKELDGLYGRNTIKDMKAKYGTSDVFAVYDQLSKSPSSTQQNLIETTDDTSLQYGGGSGQTSTQNQTKTTTSTASTSGNTKTEKAKTIEQKKGKDWSGSNSYSEQRVQTNKQNSTNEKHHTPIIISDLPELNFFQVSPLANDSIPAVNRDELEERALMREMSESAKSGDEERNQKAREQHTTLQNEKEEKQKKLETDNLNQKYGEGNWGYDANNKLIIRNKASAPASSAFIIPDDWNEFITNNQETPFGFNIQNNAVASKIFGNSTGFHTGNSFLNIHDSTPMYLSDEESLEDAYAKAYAAGNRSFTYKGKTYNTTSYTDAAAAYLQAIYDADFEKQLNGEISPETQKRLNKTKAAWGNDELKRFGINNYALRGSTAAGYPLVSSFNIADNVGLFGYNNGVNRMYNASKGFLDLGTNNNGGITNPFSMFETPEQNRTSRHYSIDRGALMSLGVSKPLEPNSRELATIYIDPNTQPVSFRSQPTKYSFSTKGNPGTFRPKSGAAGEWQFKPQTGNFVRVGTQQGGTMWNATQVYIPELGSTILYDDNNYALMPNSIFGWQGYTTIPVTAKSSGKPTAEEQARKNDFKKNGGIINYFQYIEQ